MNIQEYQTIEFVRRIGIDGKVLQMSVPNEMADFRARTFLTKEPETIAWLEEMGPDSVLYDIGANVGVYSLYAALVRSVSVFAFEPEASNLALLNRNIRLNQLDSLISALPFALSDRLGIANLALGMSMAGGSQHILDHGGTKTRGDSGRQSAIACSMDWLVETLDIPKPTDIKIDVDGTEKLVVDGAGTILGDPGLRSVLIEIDTRIDGHEAIIRWFNDAGFRHNEDQVGQSMRTEGSFAGCANYIFRRG